MRLSTKAIEMEKNYIFYRVIKRMTTNEVKVRQMILLLIEASQSSRNSFIIRQEDEK